MDRIALWLTAYYLVLHIRIFTVLLVAGIGLNLWLRNWILLAATAAALVYVVSVAPDAVKYRDEARADIRKQLGSDLERIPER